MGAGLRRAQVDPLTAVIEVYDEIWAVWARAWEGVIFVVRDDGGMGSRKGSEAGKEKEGFFSWLVLVLDARLWGWCCRCEACLTYARMVFFLLPCGLPSLGLLHVHGE